MPTAPSVKGRGKAWLTDGGVVFAEASVSQSNRFPLTTTKPGFSRFFLLAVLSLQDGSRCSKDGVSSGCWCFGPPTWKASASGLVGSPRSPDTQPERGVSRTCAGVASGCSPIQSIFSDASGPLRRVAWQGRSSHYRGRHTVSFCNWPCRATRHLPTVRILFFLMIIQLAFPYSSLVCTYC